jgi:MFS transporter, AAHS family, 3-hydroxyphenylpropionic acid transporter
MTEVVSTPPAAAPALVRSEPLQTNWALVALLWLSGVAAGLQFAKASVAFDALAAHYGASPTLAGWLLSTTGLVGVVFGASAGLVVERIGFRRSLALGLAAAAALSAFETLLPPVPLFLVARALEGAAHLAIIVAAPSCLVHAVAPGRRTIVISLWGTFFSAAFLIAGGLGLPLLAAFGLSGLFAAHGIVAAALALTVAMFIPADPPRVARVHARRPGVIAAHVSVYADPRSAIPALCFLCYTGMYLALQTLTPELASPADRLWLTAGMPAVSVVTTLLAGGLAQFGISPFRLAASAFAATFVFSLLLHFAFALDGPVAPLGFIRMAFVSLLPGAVYPMIPLLCPTPAIQARAYGAIAQLGNVGSTLGPPLFAGSMAAIGPHGLLVPALALCACGAAIALWAERHAALVKQATRTGRIG